MSNSTAYPIVKQDSEHQGYDLICKIKSSGKQSNFSCPERRTIRRKGKKFRHGFYCVFRRFAVLKSKSKPTSDGTSHRTDRLNMQIYVNSTSGREYALGTSRVRTVAAGRDATAFSAVVQRNNQRDCCADGLGSSNTFYTKQKSSRSVTPGII